MKRHIENAVDSEQPKRLKAHSSAWYGVLGSRDLLGSKIAQFIATLDTVNLIRTGKHMKTLLNENPNAFKELLFVQNVSALPKPLDTFLAKIPHEMDYLVLNATLPAGIDKLVWERFLEDLLVQIASRCPRLDTLKIYATRSLQRGPVTIDAHKLQFRNLHRLMLYHACVVSNSDMLCQIGTKYVDLYWFAMDLKENRQLLRLTGLQTVDIRIRRPYCEPETPNAWNSCEHCQDSLLACLAKEVRAKTIQRLNLRYDGVFNGEDDTKHLTAKDIHKLFPNVTNVGLFRQDNHLKRPEAWIKEDMAYFVSIKSVQFSID